MNNKPTVAISADFLTAFAALPRNQQGKVSKLINTFRNDPTHPSLNYEKINEGIDKNICSLRIDDTYRAIVVREPESMAYVLLWVDHHDEAYAWAKRKKCSINKLTGSLQVYDVQEIVEEQKTIAAPGLFDGISDDVFTKIGLPEEQFSMIRAIKNLNGLHALKTAIPEVAYEGLEWLGNGFEVDEVLDTLYPELDKVEIAENDFAAALQTEASQKSFVIVDGEEELQAIMQEPLEKWRIFLHPTQRKVVDKKFNGPARVLGGAGTGKTVVAMHRAKRLAGELGPNQKILFTTYTKNLAEDIKENLRKICAVDELKKMDIINLDAWVSSFLRQQGYEYKIVYGEDVDKAWDEAIAIAGGDLSYVTNFYKDEYLRVVQAQEVYDMPSYCRASRVGRGVRLDRKARIQIWGVFEEYQNIMNERLQRDVETAMYECRKILESKNLVGQYDAIIVDEGQDLSPSAYRLLRALAGFEHENDIFIVGDAHQRIYRNKAVLSFKNIIADIRRNCKYNYACPPAHHTAPGVRLQTVLCCQRKNLHGGV